MNISDAAVYNLLEDELLSLAELHDNNVEEPEFDLSTEIRALAQRIGNAIQFSNSSDEDD